MLQNLNYIHTYSKFVQSNLSNLNIKGMEFFFDRKAFEVRRFQNMEIQTNRI